MGAKGLKAIVFDKSGCDKPPLVDKAAFRAAQKIFNRALMGAPQTTIYSDYGTAAMTLMCDTLGALPTRNFSDGQFEGAEKNQRRAHARFTLATGWRQ
jgi:aldehyde:ferredoxin oxidoreductase